MCIPQTTNLKVSNHTVYNYNYKFRTTNHKLQTTNHKPPISQHFHRQLHDVIHPDLLAIKRTQQQQQQQQQHDHRMLLDSVSQQAEVIEVWGLGFGVWGLGFGVYDFMVIMFTMLVLLIIIYTCSSCRF